MVYMAEVGERGVCPLTPNIANVPQAHKHLLSSNSHQAKRLPQQQWFLELAQRPIQRLLFFRVSSMPMRFTVEAAEKRMTQYVYEAYMD